MRQPTSLPTYLRFERLDDNGTCKMQFVCGECGHAEFGKDWAHVGDDGSSAEMKCKSCGLSIQVRSSKEV